MWLLVVVVKYVLEDVAKVVVALPIQLLPVLKARVVDE